MDGDRLLLVESIQTISFGDDDESDTPVRASIFDGSTWTPIPWASGKRRPVQIAGPYASVVATDPYRIEVVEIATGTTVATVALRPEDTYAWPSDLRPDGQVAVVALSGIEVAGPGLAQYNLPNSGRLGGARFVANTFVAFDEEHNTLNLFGPSGQTPLGPPSRIRERGGGCGCGRSGVAVQRLRPLRAAERAGRAATAKDPCPGPRSTCT